MTLAIRTPQRWRRWRRYLASALLLHLLLGGSVYLGAAWLQDGPDRQSQPAMVFELVAPPAPASASRTVATTPAPPRSVAVLVTEVPEASAADLPLPVPIPERAQVVDAETTVSQAAAEAELNRADGSQSPSASGEEPPSVAAVDAGQNWEYRLLQHLDRYKRYPTWAERLGQEAIVRVQVRIDRNGEVRSRRLVGGRGYRLLDEEALALLARASPLPPPPPELPERDLEFTVPIDFFIDRRLARMW